MNYVGLSIIVDIIFSLKISQSIDFMSQISGEYLHYDYLFVLVIEELSKLSGCSNYPKYLIKWSRKHFY